jgi:hypothetical protein
MTKRAVLLVMLLLLIPTSLVFASSLADPVNHCLDAADPLCLTMFEGIGKLIAEWVKTFAVSISQVIAMTAWISAKLVLVAFDAIVNGTWLDVFREDLIGNIATLMPDVLRGIALGPTGLMYIALSLSGIVMILPLVSAGTDRLVRPERVIIWGILLTALFISGAAGYDLVGMIEDLRVSVIRQMMGNEDTTSSVENLLLTPMKATDAEKDLNLANLTELPAAFVTSYFPAIEREEVTVRLAESSVVFSGILNTDVETSASDIARTGGAMQALLYSLIELAAAAVILGFSLAFIFLGIAALILILFLMAALPLGFFEFGNIILTKIVERYVQIVTLSMVLALFMRVSGGLMAALPQAGSTSAIVEWLLLIGALFIALQMIFGMAYKALTDSFSSFSNSVRLATGMPLPPQGQGVMSTLGRVATGSAMGALLGGGAGALAGGAGELIGAPLMAAWKGRNEIPGQNAEDPRGNVFVENGFGTTPQAANNPQTGASASAFVPQAKPVNAQKNIPHSQPTKAPQHNPPSLSVSGVLEAVRPGPAMVQEIKPTQTVSDETSRAVSASKSLFPDEER